MLKSSFNGLLYSLACSNDRNRYMMVCEDQDVFVVFEWTSVVRVNGCRDDKGEAQEHNLGVLKNGVCFCQKDAVSCVSSL